MNAGIKQVIFTLTFLFTITFSTWAQLFPSIDNLPKNYFRNPLSVPISLSGNFAELRSNHYHMGIDLRTQQRENLPIHAAAEGYIARIKIEPGGYGRAIYIHHPNGFTTVYAHLNDFYPALEKHVKDVQYAKESWALDETFTPNLFPVTKGQFIAYSGNTGGSGGPHLHFEIRETTTDICYNPMLFGLPIPDNTAPTMTLLTVYDRQTSIYDQAPKSIKLIKNGNKYTIANGLLITDYPIISFGLNANDTHTGSSFKNGVYSMTLSMDNTPVLGFIKDQIPYEASRYLNAHADYKTKLNGGPWIHMLAQLPALKYGNTSGAALPSSIYHRFHGDGILDIADRKEHPIRIELKDVAGNSSILEFKVKYNGNYKLSALPPGRRYFPNSLDVYESDDLEFYLSENTFYDAASIEHKRKESATSDIVSAIHTIGAPYIPAHEFFTIRIRPTKQFPNPAKVIMQYSAGTRKIVKKVDWQGEWATAKFREFGQFNLIFDTIPPVITPVGFTNTNAGTYLKSAKRMVFTVSDNLGSFQNFKAYLNGKWLRFTNDKGRNFIYVFDEHCPPGKNELKLIVEDVAGNTTEKVYHFQR